MTGEDIQTFVDGLLAEQKEIDAKRKAMAKDIVDGRGLQTLDEAKAFAQAWIETAAQHCANEEYWRERAIDAETKLAALTPAALSP